MAANTCRPSTVSKPAGQRDLTVGGHPVANSQLADEPERVARPGAFAVDGERSGSRLHPPAARIECHQRQPLIRGGQIQRMRFGVAQRIPVARVPLRRAVRGHRPGFPRLGILEGRAPAGVAVLAQPPAQLVDPPHRARGFRARGSRHLLDIDLGDALDRPADLIAQHASDVLEAVAIRIIVSHGGYDRRRSPAPAQPVVLSPGTVLKPGPAAKTSDAQRFGSSRPLGVPAAAIPRARRGGYRQHGARDRGLWGRRWRRTGCCRRPCRR